MSVSWTALLLGNQAECDPRVDDQECSVHCNQSWLSPRATLAPDGAMGHEEFGNL